jgi:polysaccharide deacetylase 2 family uncharacterized protein YibQ
VSRLKPSEPRPALGVGAVAGIAVGAACLAVLLDRLVLREGPEEDPTVQGSSPEAPDAALTAPPPAPPGPARKVAVSALAGAGVAMSAIKHGTFPLRGAGRRPEETIPLVSFTCPTGRPCAEVLAAVGQAAQGAGHVLVPAARPDAPGRPVYRAVALGERPAVALRGLPSGPWLAVVVDDAGREPAMLDALLALDPDVTFAVPAEAPHATQVAQRLAAQSREVLAHLPMEAATPGDCGADCLTTGLRPEQVKERTRALLARVHGAVGANNHKGGIFTTSRPHMGAVLEVLGEQAMFFVDGRASPASVAAPAARALGVRTTVRTHYVGAGDADVSAQLKGIEVALVLDGRAVVVAPPEPAVLLALKAWLEALRGRGIHLLRASEIVR